MDAEKAFNAYVAGGLTRWSRIAYLLTGDRHQAEDLVQVTFERVARHWERVVAGGDPDPYVRRIMHSQHVSLWRRRWRSVDLWSHPPEVPVDDPTAATDRAVVVRQALARLAPRQRAVLVLRYFEDLTEAEAAKVLDCSVNTVKSQTRDALARLRSLAPELGELVGGGELR
ncbi:SigE family RNA polymerase sigma factor [Plantactinospora mayteni]|uniref:DNA-directed RNA polymerase sigma-70 factor n=1 Tax=Plantactinospora mayteni TaxID=566021 RepID=A0ABQ4EWL7_9ACTN|nr:SigE family RNA polymerase sigma factor [Plantactinospora mayteni]GIG99065.1 DNA-directed RNA polymerase sigma-70 factor [Plantactinospora mayteni]